jgi:N-acetylmuramoyl-L-alanine amidase
VESVKPIEPSVHGMIDDKGYFYPEMPSNNWNINGKGVLINNGHSSRNNGAFSDNGIVAEYDLNLRQAKHISKKLNDIGIPNKIINQMDEGDDLCDTGQKAEGYDMFCSLHHNSTEGAQYSCYMLGENPKEGSKQFGPTVSKKIAEVLNLKDSGLINYPVDVTTSAEKTTCPVVVLIESYFIDSIQDYDQAYTWSDKAADAIVDVIVDWFKI